MKIKMQGIKDKRSGLKFIFECNVLETAAILKVLSENVGKIKARIVGFETNPGIDNDYLIKETKDIDKLLRLHKELF